MVKIGAELPVIPKIKLGIRFLDHPVDGKARDRGLGLSPGLYAGPVCGDSAAEAAYAAIVALYN